MNSEKSKRTKWLHVRLTATEFEKIKTRFSKTSSQKISDYVRKVLLEKPITTYTRNKSLDDFMTELIALKTELNAIGNNYNQVVKRLYSLQHLDELKIWLKLNESSKQLLLNKVSEIKTKINQINDQWLQ